MTFYNLTDEQHSTIEQIPSIAAQTIAHHAADVDVQARYPKELMDAIRKAGFLALLVPTELGGMGQGLRTMVAVLEEIARECSSTALCYLVHLGGTATYSASDPPTEDLLRSVAKGEHMSSLALGEFGSRSHFWAPMSQVEHRDGRILLMHQKRSLLALVM